MAKILLMMFAFLVSIAALGCNFNELDDAFDNAKDLAMYGNWCGPGMSGPDAPVDSLDSLCEQHDVCYEDNVIPFGDYAACTPDADAKLTCDRVFVEGMRTLTSDSTSWPVTPTDNKKTEAEQYLVDALKIFGPCVDLYSTK